MQSFNIASSPSHGENNHASDIYGNFIQGSKLEDNLVTLTHLRFQQRNGINLVVPILRADLSALPAKLMRLSAHLLLVGGTIAGECLFKRARPYGDRGDAIPCGDHVHHHQQAVVKLSAVAARGIVGEHDPLVIYFVDAAEADEEIVKHHAAMADVLLALRGEVTHPALDETVTFRYGIAGEGSDV